MKNDKGITIFEKSSAGRRGFVLPKLDVPEIPLEDIIPEHLRRDSLAGMPELSEPDIIRHYTSLSRLNFSVDSNYYPLGSCTMKYNPRVNELVSRFSGFTDLHPFTPEDDCQSALKVMYQLQVALAELTGLPAVTLQPAAGAHGELTGMLMIKAFFDERGEAHRTKVLVPDSAHGTNPASVAIAGLDVVQIPSNAKGLIDTKALEAVMDDKVAAIMLTNPNTLGLFEEQIINISEILHSGGGLVYNDGANFNALMGYAKASDMGIDVMHLNLHKTFSTPHGGGGPGSGPVAVAENLEPFLPVPRIIKEGERYRLDYDHPLSIGNLLAFYGNFNVMIKALCYIMMMGKDGLKKATQLAVLNANYLKERLKGTYHLPYDHLCKHEFVLSDKHQRTKKISNIDIAKRLIDYGFHPPTMSFPLIVHGALMIEPTETENIETLDAFIEALIKISDECKDNEELLIDAPHNAPLRRLDEVTAARKPKVRFGND